MDPLPCVLLLSAKDRVTLFFGQLCELFLNYMTFISSYIGENNTVFSRTLGLCFLSLLVTLEDSISSRPGSCTLALSFSPGVTPSWIQHVASPSLSVADRISDYLQSKKGILWLTYWEVHSVCWLQKWLELGFKLLSEVIFSFLALFCGLDLNQDSLPMQQRWAPKSGQRQALTTRGLFVPALRSASEGLCWASPGWGVYSP